MGFLADTHIYVNHVEGMQLQLQREPYSLPRIVTLGPCEILSWSHEQSRVEGYRHHSKITFEIAV